MILSKNLFNSLTSEASNSSRKRMHYDLRNSSEDRSQRMLNAIEPGTELPIHRHRHSSETVIILRGLAEQHIYDDKGNILDRIILKPSSNIVGMNVPKGTWHRIISLESGTVIFEAKDGSYEPVLQEDILTL